MSNMCTVLVSVLLVALMSSNTVKATPVDGEVIFDTSNLPEYEMPPSCNGLTYCFDKGENYPEEKIAELLKDMRRLKVDNSETGTTIGSRQGDSYDEPDCPSDFTEKPIYYILDPSGKVRVVVQSPEKFQQIYTVKWCQNEGLITKDTPHFLKETTLEKFNIECVSTKMNFEFFVLSEDESMGNPTMELATAQGGIPVCCRCRYNVDN